MLELLAALLTAAVLFVSISRRLGLGSVLGYLVAGAVIGPSGLHIVVDVNQITEISELGVVMLLFLIGLELRPQRLWVMRRSVFGLGAAQVVVTGAVLAGLAHLTGIGWSASVVLGAGLALSSTAIVLPLLSERDLLRSPAGRISFSVLLFQDLAFIPLVALVPLLSGQALPNQLPWHEVARAVAAVIAILFGGAFLLPHLFRAIGGARTPEVFTATAFLTVVGTALIANEAGLSMSLGAFLAGVLLSSSEYRHELQGDIEPLEGLLLGFFFMSVGMGAHLGLAISEPVLILTGVVALILAKIVVSFLLARIIGYDRANALRFALALPQGSEFSFVLFGSAVAAGVLATDLSDRAILIIALSMAASPLLFAAGERFVLPHLTRRAPQQYDVIPEQSAQVIIAGFGRVGQIVGRVLRMQGIPFVALEQDSAQLQVVRRFGSQVYFGDASRLDLLRAAGADNAKLLVVALENPEQTLRVVEIAGRNFPNLKILARARNRNHAHLLMDRGVDGLVRETFYSSLKLSKLALDALGIPEADATRAVTLFRDYDEQALVDSHAFYDDERQLIQSAQQAAEELEGLFEADRDSRSRPAAHAEQGLPATPPVL